jgi:Cap4-like dsDNA endonuclease family protein
VSVSFVESLPSIFEVAPLEQGGPIVRTGFLYQDHIAARFCIQMLEDETLEEVWCEALDDITLVWRCKENVSVEFVQVKAADIPQMWSVAMICDGYKKSLIGKSLAQHRCAEPCRFRIVTRIGVHPDLKFLMRQRDTKERCIGHSDICALHRKIGQELDGLHSDVGWSPSNWLEHTLWDVAESEAAVDGACGFLSPAQSSADVELRNYNCRHSS